MVAQIDRRSVNNVNPVLMAAILIIVLVAVFGESIINLVGAEGSIFRAILAMIIRATLTISIAFILLSIINHKIRIYFWSVLALVLVGIIIVWSLLTPVYVMDNTLVERERIVELLFPIWIHNITLIKNNKKLYNNSYIICSGIVKQIGNITLVSYRKAGFATMVKVVVPRINVVLVSRDLVEKLNITDGEAVLYAPSSFISYSTEFYNYINIINNSKLNITIGRVYNPNNSITLGSFNITVRDSQLFPLWINPNVNPERIPIYALNIVIGDRAVLVIPVTAVEDPEKCGGYMGLVNANWSGNSILRINYDNLRNKYSNRLNLIYKFSFKNLTILDLLAVALIAVAYIGDIHGFLEKYSKLLVSLGFSNHYMIRRFILEIILLVVVLGAGLLVSILLGW